MQNNYDKEVESLFSYYNLSLEDRKELLSIIYPIFIHKEFQKRLDNKLYPHHDKESLGHHILSDAVITFILAKKYQRKNPDFNINIPIVIAMFHDLYELPWQNANIPKSMFVNKHGFVHPLEGIINAVNWYPEYFQNMEEANIIIDSVIHHMWPFPVRAIDTNIEALELNNTSKWYNLDKDIQNLIVMSSMRNYIKSQHISFARSRTKAGQIMSKADKIVSFSKEWTFNGAKACITGKNPNIKF